MKSALERSLQRCWYGGQAPGLGLRLLSHGYGFLVKWRHKFYVAGVLNRHRLKVPVLVVGNFTLGGTGKTPLIIALAKQLKAQGYCPGIISRGYGRKARQPVQVNETTYAEICGDEPKLIFEQTGCPVFVDSNRVAAGQRAIEVGCNVILADDGLQHYRLARDIEIEVLDGERRYGNGLLFPAGPLREVPRVCDFQIINSNLDKISQEDSGEWRMQFRISQAVSLSHTETRKLSDFQGMRVHAVAGIGNPERFFHALKREGLDIAEHPFPDHYVFQAKDFSQMRGAILMTEKDAVKCRAFALNNAWSVPVDAQLSPEFFIEVFNKLKIVALQAKAHHD